MRGVHTPGTVYTPEAKVRVKLPKVEVEGYDLATSEDRETVARMIEAIGIFGVFTTYKLIELVNEKLAGPEGRETKIPDLSRAIRDIANSTGFLIDKATLVRQGELTNDESKVNPEEFKKPEYVRALERAADVLKQAS